MNLVDCCANYNCDFEFARTATQNAQTVPEICQRLLTTFINV